MILIIDNYDSFTYNLVQYVGELGFSVKVYRNDEVSLEHLCALKPEKIIISPGPGKPEDSKITLDVIKYFSATTPILGVCLGHQSIGYLLGAQVSKSSYLMHGKTSSIFHEMNNPKNFISRIFLITVAD